MKEREKTEHTILGELKNQLNNKVGTIFMEAEFQNFYGDLEERRIELLNSCKTWVKNDNSPPGKNFSILLAEEFLELIEKQRWTIKNVLENVKKLYAFLEKYET